MKTIADYLDEEILALVEKPAQYIGGELNSYHKEWDKARCKMVFCFPDFYEIGMSHLGLRLLYEAVNREEDLLMERSFAVMPDMEELLRSHDLPLFSWESRSSLKDFDIVGFTLQYELSYTNVLNMLNLAKIPLFSEARCLSWKNPLVIAGGPCAYNAEPLAEFIDLFTLGEGEESLPELMRLLAGFKAKGGLKTDFLKEAAKIPGIYVPSLYQISYDKKGQVAAFVSEEGAPVPVVKRVIEDFDSSVFPDKCLLPFTGIVHDRMMLEIMRGCTRGCRFCQAGMIYRPVREREPQTLLKQALEQAASSGYDELALLSLSSADYGCIKTLIDNLTEELEAQKVSISLPSLRADALSVGLADQIQKVRKSGITFAPEAGNDRLRRVINKNLSEEEILGAARAAWSCGWEGIKLYFMIGLPEETDDDLRAIAELCRKIIAEGKENKPAEMRKPQRLSVAVSTFVPKAHTPFQWCGQISLEEIQRRQQLLRDLFKPLKAVTLKFHSIEESRLEAVLARGGRELSRLILLAYKKGCKNDGWREHFRADLWNEAAEQMGINLSELAEQQFVIDAQLPWEHLSCGVDKSWLYEEYKKAKKEQLTEDCRADDFCTACGVCLTLADKRLVNTGEAE